MGHGVRSIQVHRKTCRGNDGMIGYISDRSEKKYNTKTHQEAGATSASRRPGDPGGCSHCLSYINTPFQLLLRYHHIFGTQPISIEYCAVLQYQLHLKYSRLCRCKGCYSNRSLRPLFGVVHLDLKHDHQSK